MLYKSVLQVDGSSQAVEIMDTSASCCDEASDAHLQWAEAFVVVYSITDKQSYEWAASTLQVTISAFSSTLTPKSIGAGMQGMIDNFLKYSFN